jgi:hypothetical protein
MCHSWGMRNGVEVRLRPGDRERLEAVLVDRNSPQKHVWRARIILATAEGCGTTEVMRRAGVSKPCVWRWQRRFMEAGVDELVHDKTRKPGKAPVPDHVVARLIERTLGDPRKRDHALDQSNDGQCHGLGDQHGAENLALPWPGAAPTADLQAQPRPAICRQAARCGRALRVLVHTSSDRQCWLFGPR